MYVLTPKNSVVRKERVHTECIKAPFQNRKREDLKL